MLLLLSYSFNYESSNPFSKHSSTSISKGSTTTSCFGKNIFPMYGFDNESIGIEFEPLRLEYISQLFQQTLPKGWSWLQSYIFMTSNK